MRNNALSYTKANRERVRRLKADMGVSERVFWELVKGGKTGFRFRAPHPVDVYVLDFYCAEASLCVEIDGPHHADRAGADARRDECLRAIGVHTIRIPTEDLWEETSVAASRWLDRVLAVCEERSGRKAWEQRRKAP